MTQLGKQRYSGLSGKEQRIVDNNSKYIKRYQKAYKNMITKPVLYDDLGNRAGMGVAKKRVENKERINDEILSGIYKKSKYLNEEGTGLNEKGVRTVKHLGLKSGFANQDKRIHKAAEVVRAVLSKSGQYDKLYNIKDRTAQDKATRQAVSKVLGRNAKLKDWYGDRLDEMLANKISNRLLYETESTISEKDKRKAKRRYIY